MSSLLSFHESAMKLLFDPRTYVAGERISGVVELDVPMAIEDKIEQVRVKLRGSAVVKIVRQRGQVIMTYRSTKDLAHDDKILWTQAEGRYPPAGSNILRLPFEFQIPRDAASSFHTEDYRQEATISYGIEVVADRPGILRFNRRLGSVFPVLSMATREEAEDAFRLRQGWNGEWKTVERSEEIRKHLWGERSSVQAQLLHPAINSFPTGIPIPINLIITTITKTMDKSDTPEDAFSPNPDKPLFPAPPQGPTQGVNVTFDVEIFLAPDGEDGYINEQLPDAIVAFNKSNTSSRGVQVTRSQPVWIPDGEKGQEGKWKRQVRFDTTMILQCSPTIDLGILRTAYALKVAIDFPGMGNDLEFKVPIEINSGLGPFDPTAPPPPPLDLPPAYFTGEHHDWDGDEKSG